MRTIQISIILSIIVLANADRRQYEHLYRRTTAEVYFPPELRADNHNILSDLTVPNEKFCTEQKLLGSGRLLTLPWWYHYCARFYEKKEKSIEEVGLNVPYYRGVLKEVHAYKKKLKEMRDIWKN